MLVGEHEHSIDAKTRLTLPARFRESFSGGGYVTRGMDGCLYAYARDEWHQLVDSRLGTLDPLSKDDRMLQRYFFSGAAEVEPDKQGRIMLPAALIQHAKLGREDVVAGVFDHVEIWDRAAWRAQMREVAGSAE